MHRYKCSCVYLKTRECACVLFHISFIQFLQSGNDVNAMMPYATLVFGIHILVCQRANVNQLFTLMNPWWLINIYIVFEGKSFCFVFTAPHSPSRIFDRFLFTHQAKADVIRKDSCFLNKDQPQWKNQPGAQQTYLPRMELVFAVRHNKEVLLSLCYMLRQAWGIVSSPFAINSNEICIMVLRNRIYGWWNIKEKTKIFNRFSEKQQ